MKEIKLVGLDQSVFFTKLESGLEIYFIPYENKSNYAMHYITKFGSRNMEFKPIDEKKFIKVPAGIAHFLEHKMFEQEDGEDPFSFAAKTGTSSNATTSFNTTRYYFEGNMGFEENLNYLLDFVHTPYFTDENVEKEKGIITEEIKQYDDEIDWFLDEEIRKAIFHKDPVRFDIAGTEDSISEITKELLYQTYNTYYQPSNMILMISGSFDKERAMNIITTNESLKNATTNKPIEEKKEKEPEEVQAKTKKLFFNVANKKVAYVVKIPLKGVKDPYRLNLYLGLFNSIKFGLSSTFREQMKQKKLITSFYTEREIYGEYLLLSYIASSDRPEEFVAEVKKELTTLDIEESEIERLKKVWISSEVVMVDNISLTLDNILYDVITYGNIIPNKTEIYRSLNVVELKKMISKINFSNASFITVCPKK
ncbi:MAG: pitrilysin family protein [bacterium]|nr:pitrilysin family protein [bacterium]